MLPVRVGVALVKTAAASWRPQPLLQNGKPAYQIHFTYGNDFNEKVWGLRRGARRRDAEAWGTRRRRRRRRGWRVSARRPLHPPCCPQGEFTPGKVGYWHWDKRDWTVSTGVGGTRAGATLGRRGAAARASARRLPAPTVPSPAFLPACPPAPCPALPSCRPARLRHAQPCLPACLPACAVPSPACLPACAPPSSGQVHSPQLPHAARGLHQRGCQDAGQVRCKWGWAPQPAIPTSLS